MNATKLSRQLTEEMERIKHGMADPGYDDFQKYREAVQRYHAFKETKAMLKLSTDKDDEEGT